AKFQNLKSALDKWTGQQNEEKFRNAGRNPRKPASLTDGTKNPWSKETWNLTEQGRLLRDDPELAKYFKDNTRR
ncbi:MAG: hypothetical protein EOM68_28145, partial [Spirochaetia bacterium]|nr:hypothetical protein [Spirochaetia bacterium]